MSDDDDKKEVVSPRGTNLDHTTSEELAPRKRGLSGLISRLKARSSVITDAAETEKRQARKEALEAQIELSGTVEKALDAQSRLHYVQQNQDKIAAQVHSETEMEYELRHAERELTLQEKMADVERRRKALQQNHELDVEADALKREEREYGFEERRANLDAKRNPPEEEASPPPPSDNTPRWEKQEKEHKKARARLDDWYHNRQDEIDGDNAKDEKGRARAHAELDAEYKILVEEMDRRHRDERNAEFARKRR